MTCVCERDREEAEKKVIFVCELVRASVCVRQKEKGVCVFVCVFACLKERDTTYKDIVKRQVLKKFAKPRGEKNEAKI